MYYIYFIVIFILTSDSVNGGYSSWSAYTKCSRSCGTGIQTRERTCANPTPIHNCTDCSLLGKPYEARLCNTQSCAVYGDWSDYNKCTKTCGSGVKTRERTWTYPTPEHSVVDYSQFGRVYEAKACNTYACVGSAFTMTFTNKTLNIPTIQKPATTLSTFTLTTWVKYEDLNGDVTFFIIHPDTDKGMPYCNFVAPGINSKLLTIDFFGDSRVHTGFKPMLNIWNHLSITRQGKAFQFFVNGTLMQSKNLTTIPVINGNVHLGIGNDADGVGPGGKCTYQDITQGFVGSITHMFLWKRALNQEEITAAYKMNPVLDGMFISWDEMRKTTANKDVVVTDFPFLAEKLLILD